MNIGKRLPDAFALQGRREGGRVQRKARPGGPEDLRQQTPGSGSGREERQRRTIRKTEDSSSFLKLFPLKCRQCFPFPPCSDAQPLLIMLLLSWLIKIILNISSIVFLILLSF